MAVAALQLNPAAVDAWNATGLQVLLVIERNRRRVGVRVCHGGELGMDACKVAYDVQCAGPAVPSLRRRVAADAEAIGDFGQRRLSSMFVVTSGTGGNGVGNLLGAVRAGRVTAIARRVGNRGFLPCGNPKLSRRSKRLRVALIPDETTMMSTAIRIRSTGPPQRMPLCQNASGSTSVPAQ
jgi:hypothetical protein